MPKKIDVSTTVDAYRKDSFDPQGSYTGLPLDDDDAPVQDADDL